MTRSGSRDRQGQFETGYKYVCIFADVAAIRHFAESLERRKIAMGTLVKSALAAEYLILSSAGSHAREDWCTIITRKTADIASTGHSIWVLNSNAARPDVLQSFCKDHPACYVIFLGRERDGESGSGTSTVERAQCYSGDNRSWSPLDRGLSHVTGRINRATTGLWLNALEEMKSGSLNLMCFRKQSNGEILARFERHESTYPVRRVAPAQEGTYEILAVGRLAPPFGVWLNTRPVPTI
jgi:hypothetical protein